jgi:3alpha(or 20beta)-hydroxysteroid dehydrogenase
MGLLDGKVALVTGGARGQGASHAKGLVKEGAYVYLTDISDADGEALAKSLDGRAAYIHHDVSSEEEWAQAVARIAKEKGRLDVLVNNAGIYQQATIAETSVAMFDRITRINQLGTFLGMKWTQELLRKSGGGSIINVSSIAGMKGFQGALAYSGSKWAVRGMTKVAAVELAPDKIRVNTIYPGTIATGMLAENSDEVNRATLEATPLKRIAQPEEVTHLIVFLASPQSDFITGADISIDGGLSL